MSDAMNWNKTGTLGVLQLEADQELHFSDVRTGALHVLVKAAMADGQQARGYKILIGDKDYAPEEIKALSERDDFPADES